MDLILHIGRHKTGTSSLQHFLSKNSRVLSDHGIIYPRAMRQPVAHHGLAYMCSPKRFAGLAQAERKRLENDFRCLWEEIAGAERALVSSEAFQNASAASAAEVLGSSATVIVYIREQLPYLLSAYGQAVKSKKLTMSLEEYEVAVFRADYFKFLCEWEAAFAKGMLVVRIFAKNDLARSDIRYDFLDALGLSDSVAAFDFSGGDGNISISGTLLEFKRCLNQTQFEPVIAPRKLYSLLQQVALREPALNNGPEIAPSYANYLREKYLPVNEAVCARFCPGRKTLFGITDTPGLTGKGEILSFSDVARVLNDVHASDLGSRLLALIATRG